MDVERIVQPAYCVIGHEGSTADGEGFVMRLWQLSNERFAEAAHLAKREADGRLLDELWRESKEYLRRRDEQ